MDSRVARRCCGAVREPCGAECSQFSRIRDALSSPVANAGLLLDREPRRGAIEWNRKARACRRIACPVLMKSRQCSSTIPRPLAVTNVVRRGRFGKRRAHDGTLVSSPCEIFRAGGLKKNGGKFLGLGVVLLDPVPARLQPSTAGTNARKSGEGIGFRRAWCGPGPLPAYSAG